MRATRFRRDPNSERVPFTDEYDAVEYMECVSGILSSIGQENAGFRHDGRRHHAFTPVVDLIVVKPAFAEAEKLDHIRSAETDGIRELSLEFSLVQGYLHESHVLVTIRAVLWMVRNGKQIQLK
jgi:hypothetical protein